MPLTWVTYGLDYVLWGMNPSGYHLTNLILHVGNALLVYFIATRLLCLAVPPAAEERLGIRIGAVSVALLFAVHPLRVESVAWASERHNLLSGFFYLLAVLVYLRHAEIVRGGDTKSVRWYWTCFALFVLALGSKIIAVSLPVILLLLDAYPLGRLRSGPDGRMSRVNRRVLWEKAPFFVVAGVASLVHLIASLGRSWVAPATALSLGERVEISGYALIFYLKKTLLPLGLSPLYELPPRAQLYTWPFLLSTGVAVVATGVAVALRRRMPAWSASWAAYVVILAPVLGIVQAGPQVAADRYTYLACVGWALLAGAGVRAVWSRWRCEGRPMRALGFTAGVVLTATVLGSLTWSQTRVWQDSSALWAHVLAVDERSSYAHGKVGAALFDAGKVTDGLAHLRRAVELGSEHPLPSVGGVHRSVLAQALVRHGDTDEAIEHLREAARLNPAISRREIGLALAAAGQTAEAIREYREVLRSNPTDAEAHHYLGVALQHEGQTAEATEHQREALRLFPGYVEAHDSLAQLLASRGQVAEAIEQYRDVLRLQPDSARAHSNLGNLLFSQGQFREATALFRAAVRLSPDSAELHNNLGAALAESGEPVEALEHFREAVRLKPGYRKAQENLDATLRALGRSGNR